MSKQAPIGGGLALLAMQAGAIPVTLSPDAVRPTDERGAAGFFPGTGFRFTAQTPDDFPERDALPDIGTIADTPSGADNLATGLTTERVDGRPFDLAAISIPFFYVGEVIEFGGVARGPDGEVVEHVDDLTENLADFVSLRGATASGGAVAATLRPVTDDTTRTSRFFLDNPSPRFLADGFAPGFEDLVSLTFEAANAFDDALCDPLILAEVDPRFAHACPTRPTRRSRTSPWASATPSPSATTSSTTTSRASR